jgi:hypothetical protein
MLGSRRGRPSLIGRAAGTAARTAIITKTATTVAGSAAQKQSAQPQHAMAVAPAVADASGQPDLLVRLRTFAELHDGGILADADFIAKVKESLSG